MKNIFVLVISLLLLASCGDGNEKAAQENTDPAGDHIVSTYVNGNPKLVQTYEVVDGKRLAIYEKEYYEDHTILKEGRLNNGKRDGLWKSFRRDGLLWSEGNYDNGVRHGITVTYHPNGQKYYYGEYNKGLKSGVWKFYDEEGNFVKEEDFNKK